MATASKTNTEARKRAKSINKRIRDLISQEQYQEVVDALLSIALDTKEYPRNRINAIKIICYYVEPRPMMENDDEEKFTGVKIIYQRDGDENGE